MARSPNIRARQRSRTALKAFSSNLIPALHEVGIDRVQISVSGAWQTNNISEYREMILGGTDFADWFRSPVARSSNTMLQTRSTPRSTLGSVSAILRHPNGIATNLNFNLSANPTRTLAHLMADYGVREDFITFIAGLRPAQFFALADNNLSRGRGTLDNWVHNSDLLLDRLGENPFSQFLPIYGQQLKLFVAELFAPTLTPRIEEIDGNIRVTDEIATISLEWARVRIPQIETYFERHHSQAIAAVQAFASRALANLNHAKVSRYSALTGYFVERLDDGLLVGSRLTDLLEVAIYAKDKSRLRFEIRRKGKGSYSAIDELTDPDNTLLQIFNLERQNLLSQCRWCSVGEMFEEPYTPSITDLSSLCALISDACAEEQVPSLPVFRELFEDGGTLRAGLTEIPQALISRLIVAGVLETTTLRRRAVNVDVQRVALREEYRTIVASMYEFMHGE